MIDALRRPLPGLTLVFSFALGSMGGAPSVAAGEDTNAGHPAAVATARHPVVPGFERFHGRADSDAVAGGLILLGELNCTSCHAAGDATEGRVLRKQAPILDSVGSRVRPSYLRAFLGDPHAVKPGTTMPDLLAALPPDEKAATVEALVHFLASYGKIVEKHADPRAIPNGKKLYHAIGCVACHGRRDPAGPALAASMPLGDLASKYTVPSLAAFLQDPLKVRPSGRMPALNLVKKEAFELACYLLKDLRQQSRPNLAYSYYEGQWQTLPDFDTLTPKATGTASGFDVSLARRSENMALRFEGYFHNEAAGEYTFHLTSDDGSKLFIDDMLVVDNDGLHAPETKSGKVELIKGAHKLVVGVFNATNEAELEVEYEGRGRDRQSVLTALTLNRDGSDAEPDAVAAETTAGDDRFRVDRALAETGRAHFARLGCASCHQLRAGIAVIATTLTAPPLSALTARPEGCLATDHAAGGRMYDLKESQRSALLAAIEALKEERLPAASPRAVIARTMTAFNCYACHVRDGRGGVEEARQDEFRTTQQEMGDEGRIPPSLDGVGAKLQAGYMKRYFDAGVKDRPYMLTRMPRFGAENLGGLIAAFEALDPLEPVETPTFDESPRRVKSVGRFLCGGEALGCIKCHNFNGVAAEGVQAVDMTVMTRRLRHDWFHRYLVDTQAYRPGTRMPTGWPGGKTMLPQVLDGDTPRQIEAVWQFLSDGREAIEPYGLGREPIPLTPENEPIIYRNFIRGAGPRAIGVGYPEHANLAFDANDLRLALIWQGAFIDAARHWTGRGSGFQPPLGDNILELPEGPGFALLSNPDELWPDDSARERGDAFRGYRLSKEGRPTFLYDVGPIHIADVFEPITGANPKAATFRRTLTLTPAGPPPSRDLWFRAIAADRIEPRGDGAYRIDGEWTMKIDSNTSPLLRKSAGKSELLVPVKTEDGRETRIVQEFAW